MARSAGPRRLVLPKRASLAVDPRARFGDRRLRTGDGRGALILADSPVGITDGAGAGAWRRRWRRRGHRSPARSPWSGLADTGTRWPTPGPYPRPGGHPDALVAGHLGIYVSFLRTRLAPSSSSSSRPPSWPWPRRDGPAGPRRVRGHPRLRRRAAGDGRRVRHARLLRRCGAGATTRAVGAVARPVVMGGLATAAAFGVMLLEPPRAAAAGRLLSMAGIALSLVISLVVLPHLVPRAATLPPLPRRPAAAPRLPRLPVCRLAARSRPWRAASAGAFRRSMNSLNHVTPAAAAAEEEIRQRWGDLRGQGHRRAPRADTSRRRSRATSRPSTGACPGAGPRGAAQPRPGPPRRGRLEARRRWLRFWDGAGRSRGGLAAHGRRPLGFSPGAFAPFVGRARRPRPRPDVAARSRLRRDRRRAAAARPGRAQVLTLAPDDAGRRRPLAAPGALPGSPRVAQTSGSRSPSRCTANSCATCLSRRW